MSSFGREVIRIVAVDQPFCTREYGDAFASPAGGCTAVLGIDSNRKCYNTRATCADPANYSPGTLTLKFTQDQLDVPRYYGPVIPSLVGIDTTPLEVNLGGLDKSASALGQREIVTINLQDHKHSDLLVDKYRLERPTGEASVGVGGSPFGSPTTTIISGGSGVGGSPIPGTIQCAQGTVTISSADIVGTTINVTTDGAGQPLTGFDTAAKRVVRFKWANRSATGFLTNNNRYGSGFATGSTARRAYSAQGGNGSTPSQCDRAWTDSSCILIQDTVGAIVGRVDYNAEVTDGFQLIVVDQLPGSQLVTWEAEWGDELEHSIIDFVSPAAIGVQSYDCGLDLTGGMDNKLVYILGGVDGAVDTVRTSAYHMIGAAAGDTPVNAVLLGCSQDAQNPTVTWSYCRTGECISMSTAVNAISERGSVNGWSSTGFDIDWTEVNGTAGLLRYSALVTKGPTYKLFDTLTRTDTVSTDVVVGIEPIGLMFFSHSKSQSSADTTQDQDTTSVGFATGASSRSVAARHSDDNVAQSREGMTVRTDAVYAGIPDPHTSVEDALMDIVDFNVSGGGFTEVMDDPDPSASFIWGVAVGQSDLEEPGGGSGEDVVVEEELQEITISGPGIFDPYERGTFWGKWLARNPYYTAYALRVYEGYLGDAIEKMRARHYILDKIDGPKDGAVKITARDLFSRIEARKAVAPTASRGELASAITAIDTAATLSPTGIGDLDYPAMSGSPSEFYVSIGDEIIKCSRSGNALTLIERGAFNTIPQAHDEEDLVQWVLIYQAQSPHDIAYDLLVNYSEVPAANINLTEWDTLASSITDLFTAKIAEPTPVEDLLGELAMQAGFTIWPDVSTGMIKFTPLRPGSVFPTVTDNEWIVEGSLSVSRQNNKRVSQVWVYYGQINPTESLDEAKNYSSRVVTIDPDAEDTDQYAEPAIMNVYSRWVPQFGRQSAERIGERLLAMFRDPPLEAKFNIHSSRDGELEIARYFALETHDIQDDTGAEESTALATTSIERGLNEITITAQEVAFTEEITSEGALIRRIYIENDVTDLNLRTLHDTLFVAPVGGSPGEVVEFYVLSGVIVGSSSSSSPALTTGTWPSMSTLPLLVNEGRIQGMGGTGGTGGNTGGNGGVGSTGGTALQATSAIQINNASGQIWAGGGGGGGGGGYSDPFGTGGGGGGGGGSGTLGGIGGAPGIGSDGAGQTGSVGNNSTGGSGGAGHSQFGFVSGTGGAGGTPGSSGNSGNSGTNGGTGGAGGSGGNSVSGNSFITWISTGDRQGAVS